MINTLKNDNILIVWKKTNLDAFIFPLKMKKKPELYPNNQEFWPLTTTITCFNQILFNVMNSQHFKLWSSILLLETFKFVLRVRPLNHNV